MTYLKQLAERSQQFRTIVNPPALPRVEVVVGKNGNQYWWREGVSLKPAEIIRYLYGEGKLSLGDIEILREYGKQLFEYPIKEPEYQEVPGNVYSRPVKLYKNQKAERKDRGGILTHWEWSKEAGEWLIEKGILRVATDFNVLRLLEGAGLVEV